MKESKYDGKGNSKELPMAKVMIAIPGAEWKSDMGMCLMTLIAASTHPIEGYAGVDLCIQNSKGSILPQLRQKLVEAAQDAEATHILFVDSDMVFPPYMLGALLEHKQRIVGLNCPTKMLPSTPTARLQPINGYPQGVPLYQEDFENRENPLLKVWRVGTGIMLIEMSVFQEIPSPYFPISYDHEQSCFVGEDWGFCAQAQEAGIAIHVDIHLSHCIRHVGNLAFTHEMTERNNIRE